MMKKNRQNHKSGKLNNLGFSLVELIISIAILVIIMTPLMNNFFRAKMINNKAEDLQVQSNLAANIMEGLRTISMPDTIDQFNIDFLGSGDFDIIPVVDSEGNTTADEVMRLMLESGVYKEYSEPLPEEQTAYYFAIHGVKIGGSAYDALIKIDSSPYKNTINKMNNYYMPDVINLNEKSNGLLFSNGGTAENAAGTADSDALATYLIWGEAYARRLWESTVYAQYLIDMDLYKDQCEINEMQEIPTPIPIPVVTFNAGDYPEYCSGDEVKKYITKTMDIVISQNASNQSLLTFQINYHIDYTGNELPYDGEKDITYPVAEYQYAGILENVYLFFEASAFNMNTAIHHDMVNIDSAIPINFYVTDQDGTNPFITITRTSDLITSYTNSTNTEIGDSFSSTLQPEVIKTKKKDRIYDVTIKICEYVNGNPEDKYKKVLYTIKSTKEEVKSE